MKKIYIFLLGYIAVCNTGISQPSLQEVTGSGNSTDKTIELLRGAYFNVNSGSIGTGDAKVSFQAVGNNSNSGYGHIQTSYHAFGYSTPLILNALGGNVGIGTTSPEQRLDVNGSTIIRGSLVSSVADANIGGNIALSNPAKTAPGTASTWRIFNMSGTYGNSLQFWAYDNVGCNGGLCNNKFTLTDNGNVGIGINEPAYKLDINGNANIQTDITLGSGTGVVYSDGSSYAIFHDGNYLWQNRTNTATRMMLGSNGDLLVYGNQTIGTDAAQKNLSVNGNVKTRKLTVTQTNWPDYVFDSAYQLKPLQQVEQFIQQNKHLPEVPSAVAVSNEGVDVGNNQALLLKKIEELTLYIIQQNKELEAVKKRMAEMEAKAK